MDGGDLPQDENARSGPTLPGPSGEKGVPLVDLSPEAMVRAGGRNPPETGTKKWEELEKTMNTLLERIKCAVCFEAYGTAPPPFHYCINEHFLCFGCYEEGNYSISLVVKCPMCRQKGPMIKSRVLALIADQLLRKRGGFDCPNFSKCMSTRSTRGELKAHKELCPESRGKCPACGTSMQRAALFDHVGECGLIEIGRDRMRLLCSDKPIEDGRGGRKSFHHIHDSSLEVTPTATRVDTPIRFVVEISLSRGQADNGDEDDDDDDDNDRATNEKGPSYQLCRMTVHQFFKEPLSNLLRQKAEAEFPFSLLVSNTDPVVNLDEITVNGHLSPTRRTMILRSNEMYWILGTSRMIDIRIDIEFSEARMRELRNQ